MSIDNFKGKLLVCDMDGTLLNSRHQVSEENRKALQHFVRNGGLFTVATGRNEISVRDFIHELPICAPVIVYNGASIYDFPSGRIFWHRYLDNSAKAIVEELMNVFPELGVEVYQGEDIYFVRENEITFDHLSRETFVPVRIPLSEVPFPWVKVLLAWDNKNLKEVEEYLNKKQLGFRHVFSEPFFLELLNFEATKGHALKELTGILGIPASSVIAMGDNPNDEELLEFAGTGIAVSNAHDVLKRVANLFCCHHDENAVSQVIGWLEKGVLA